MIEVKNLTKKYGANIAVSDLSFTVLDGEIVGFLGPNGAGKTTTMNIMTGYLSPTEGTVIINGFDILQSPTEAKSHIGYLPDTPPLYPNMTVWEYLNFAADIKKVKKSEKKAHIEEIMERVKVSEMRNRLIKNLSKGYRQRVGLCQAMVGSPDVIILDEPTVGLDPKQIIEMRSVIKDLGKMHTVILSSHILSEVSAVCDRVMIINKGVIVASDTPDRLASAVTGLNRLQIRIKGSYDSVYNVFNGKPFIAEVRDLGSKEEGSADISLMGNEGDDIREAVFKTCADNNITLLSMKNLDLSLEEIFLQITSASNIMSGDNAGVSNEENSDNTEGSEILEEKGENINDGDI